MNIDQAQDRFNNDPMFRAAVEGFYQLMFEMKLTHGELQGALFLAAIHIEQYRPAPSFTGTVK